MVLVAGRLIRGSVLDEVVALPGGANRVAGSGRVAIYFRVSAVVTFTK